MPGPRRSLHSLAPRLGIDVPPIPTLQQTEERLLFSSADRVLHPPSAVRDVGAEEQILLPCQVIEQADGPDDLLGIPEDEPVAASVIPRIAYDHRDGLDHILEVFALR